jgi:hypothetical protein
VRCEKTLQCCGLVPVLGISFIYRVDLSLLRDLQASLKYINPTAHVQEEINHEEEKLIPY